MHIKNPRLTCSKSYCIEELMKPEKRALIVGGGGLRGAYAVGVLRKIYDYGGPDLFDTIYTVSVGVYASTFFLAHQVETMENTWKYYVHGSQLINFANILKGEPILGLDYLESIFKSKRSYLDVDKVINSKQNLYYVLTDYDTGKPEYFNAKSHYIFDMMKASSALPCVYPKPIIIKGRRYFDGGASDPIPINKALSDGFKDIYLVLTRPDGFERKPTLKIVPLLCIRSKGARNALYRLHDVYNQSENLIRSIKNNPQGINLTVFRPKQIKVTRFTRDQTALIEAIEQGKRDAEEVMSSMKIERSC